MIWLLIFSIVWIIIIIYIVLIKDEEQEELSYLDRIEKTCDILIEWEKEYGKKEK